MGTVCVCVEEWPGPHPLLHTHTHVLKVMIKNLPPVISPKKLARLMGRCGEVHSVELFNSQAQTQAQSSGKSVLGQSSSAEPKQTTSAARAKRKGSGKSGAASRGDEGGGGEGGGEGGHGGAEAGIGGNRFVDHGPEVSASTQTQDLNGNRHSSGRHKAGGGG